MLDAGGTGYADHAARRHVWRSSRLTCGPCDGDARPRRATRSPCVRPRPTQRFGTPGRWRRPRPIRRGPLAASCESRVGVRGGVRVVILKRGRETAQQGREDLRFGRALRGSRGAGRGGGVSAAALLCTGAVVGGCFRVPRPPVWAHGRVVVAKRHFRWGVCYAKGTSPKKGRPATELLSPNLASWNDLHWAVQLGGDQVGRGHAVGCEAGKLHTKFFYVKSAQIFLRQPSRLKVILFLFSLSRTIRALEKFQMWRVCHGGCVVRLFRMKRRDSPPGQAQTGGHDDPTFVTSAP